MTEYKYFPLSLSFGSSGGPQLRTDIIRSASGREVRNSAQSGSRRRFNVGVGVKSQADMETLLAFYEARSGELEPFLFRDPFDYKGEGEVIGTGDGAQTKFDLIKSYGERTRRIYFPDVSSLSISVDSVITPVTWNPQTKQIEFASPPINGATITADFTFDILARFDSSQLDLALESFGAGRAVNIPIIEVNFHA